jgi:hypothetical protein
MYEIWYCYFYVTKKIIINKNKILYKLFYTLFVAPYTKKRKYQICIQILYLSSFEKIYDKFKIYLL